MLSRPASQNVHGSITESLCGICISFNEVHAQNADSPICTSVFGKFILDKDLQSPKA